MKQHARDKKANKLTLMNEDNYSQFGLYTHDLRTERWKENGSIWTMYNLFHFTYKVYKLKIMTFDFNIFHITSTPLLLGWFLYKLFMNLYAEACSFYPSSSGVYKLIFCL